MPRIPLYTVETLIEALDKEKLEKQNQNNVEGENIETMDTSTRKAIRKSKDPSTFGVYSCVPEELHERTMSLLGKRLDPILMEEVAVALSAKINRWLLHVKAPELITKAYNSMNMLREYVAGNLILDTEGENIDGYDQLMDAFMEGVSALTEFGGQLFEDINEKELKPFIYE